MNMFSVGKIKLQTILMFTFHSNVESSLFIRNQYSWVSWFTLTLEFTSPRTYHRVLNHFNNIHKGNKPVTRENMSQRGSKNILIHKYWPVRMKMIPLCIYSMYPDKRHCNYSNICNTDFMKRALIEGTQF